MIKCILELPNKSPKSAGDAMEEDILVALLSEAARKNNISKSCICINLKKNKPIMGKIWRYVDE